MKIGIDVGGTFTDAVVVKGQDILSKAKVPTKSDDLLGTIIHALDALKAPAKKVKGITVSTTLVTNAVLENKLSPATLLLFPGKGVKLDSYSWPIAYHALVGEIDFRGREIMPPDELEWRRLASNLNTPAVAIVGKFSHRNSLHEERLAQFLLKQQPELKIGLGHQWGKPNFYRRALTTYLNLTASELYDEFRTQLEAALRQRGITVPVSVLRGDGGISPLPAMRPIESIYSGPAASILGAMAQSEPGKSYVVVDIGGTTTDIGLVLSDNPLMSSKGAKIGPYLTSVRSLSVRSVAVGGDSQVVISDGRIQLLDQRQGPAFCLGGPVPTPTDAMRVLRLIDYGSLEKAKEAMALLRSQTDPDLSLEEVAQAIIVEMTEKISAAIFALQHEWESEPAYKVWEVLHPHEAGRWNIVLSGGGGQGLVKPLAERLQRSVEIPRDAEISNAIGTALARQAVSYTLHLDTSLRRYRIEETGEQGEWAGSRRPHNEVKEFLLQRMSQALNLNMDELKIEEEGFDFFPLVENWHSTGYIVRGALHITPGVDWRIKRV